MENPAPSTATRPSDSVLFPIDDFDRLIVDKLLPNAPSPGKWAAMNAVRHANRAWKLREIDPQMAVFRAITGEEESATAIFHALRRRRYADSEKLSPRDHLQKNAVTPFIEAVHASIAPAMLASFKGFTLEIDESAENPTLQLRFTIERAGEEDLYAWPEPPLHFRINHGTTKKSERVWDFEEKIAEHVMRTGADSVLDALRIRANLRNRLLYAASDGIPMIQTPVEPGLELIRRNTFRNLKIYLMIDGHPSGQLFVQQTLSAFVKMLGKVPKGIDFDGPPDFTGTLRSVGFGQNQ